MLPPQSFRRSPGRDPRTDSHKRGRSLESGLSFKEKDDLALFNEMQSKEPDNFLLQSTDDFEDIFTAKLKPFSDFKLGITIPVRGEPSDLLNADGNKNDYDWLLTPPDTPLFPSLDDEPAPANLVHSGRPRSRPISISRSSTMEKRSSRGSASPQRLSPSPRSGNSKPSQRRPSSATRSSRTPSLRRTSPSQRLSPPPIKSPTPVMRSATPTPRQTSEVSTGSVISSRMRGTSPISTSRGNSASPKIRAWQSNIPGFSLEAPPNLRTSLADRPVSYVRGSSPASRNSRDSASKFGRQSMSPTASRSISSSHSHERDRLSSHSKGSLASSGDDDADSLQSIPASGLEQPLPTRMVRGVPSNCSSAFSKKLTKRNSPNAAPKRSFDYAMRQMDHRSPQNMFRPLLSSVPSSTFHSSSHHTMISRNSSVTTSSNDSSDQATSGAPDTEGSGQTQDDMANGCGRRPFPDTQDVFPCDKLDVPCDKFEANHGGSEKLSHLDATVARNATSESFYVQGDSFEVGPENPLLCTRCGCRYFSNELKECDINICPDCKQKEELSTGPIPVTRVDVAPNLSDPLTMIFEDHGPIEAAEPCMVVQQLPKTVEMGELRSGLLTASHEEDANANQSSNGSPKQSCFLDDSPPSSAEEKVMQLLSDQQEVKQPPTACSPSDTNCQGQELYKCDDSLQSKVDVAEGVGISVLVLKRSGSRKGHIMHSRNMTASAISYDDSFCARDSTISMRSSVGHGSASTSSSMDLTSVRNVDIPMQRQLSSTRSELSSKPQSNVSSFSGTSTHAYQVLGISASHCKENFEVSAGNVGRTLHETQGQHPESFLASENAELPDPVTFLSRRTLSGDDDFNCSCFKAKDTDSLELSSHNVSTQSEGGNSLASLAVDEDHVLHGINEVFPASVESEVNMEEPAIIHESSFMVEDSAPDNGADQKEIMEIIHQNSLDAMSEIEIDNCCLSSPASPIEIALKDDFQEPSFVYGQDKDFRSSVALSNDSDHRQGIVEDSTVMVHNGGGRMTRSLTLEEATDTILFCSSIIHTLAYEAAGIAIEKEKENLAPLEGYRQAAITPGNARWDPRGRTPSRRKIKSQKPKQLWVETETKSPPFRTEPNNNPDEPTTCIVGLQNKVDNMKPPPKLESKCNCRIM